MGTLVLAGAVVRGVVMAEMISFSREPAAPALFFFGAGIAWFGTDLVLARGLLQRKILFINIIIGSGIALRLFYSLSVSLPGIAGFAEGGSCCLTALILLLIIIDIWKINENTFILDEGRKLPPAYKRKMYLKIFSEIILRLFPYPVPVGLYPLNGAENNDPVVVTGNYDETVRRVVDGVGRKPAWLLVCDSRGVNIWCSTLAGHFGTAKVVEAIELTGLSEVVSTRRLIFPQLIAAGISLEELKRRSGFRGVFGPHSCKRLSQYMDGEDNSRFPLATFNLTQRIEMSIGSPAILVMVLLLIYNFIDPAYLFILLPIIYLLALFHGIIFPCRPIQNVLVWSIVCGVVAGWAGFYILGMIENNLLPLQSSITLGVGFCYLINEFTGWSPLLKYNLLPSIKPDIIVSKDVCIGCGICITVCPRGVYNIYQGKSFPGSVKNCTLCKSCFSQCPVGAIEHSADKK